MGGETSQEATAVIYVGSELGCGPGGEERAVVLQLLLSLPRFPQRCLGINKGGLGSFLCFQVEQLVSLLYVKVLQNIFIEKKCFCLEK